MADLSLDDIHAVIRLVREVCDRWDDPRVWRSHLLDGVCQLVNANSGSIQGQTFEAARFLSGPTLRLATHGMPEEFVNGPLEHALDETEHRSVADLDSKVAPGFAHLFERFARDGWATVARAEIVDDTTHFASAFHQLRSSANCDDYLMSVRPLIEAGQIEVVTLDRTPGAARFMSRDVTILKLLHDEIAPLIGLRLATEEHLCRDGLSVRLRSVLEAILDGSSEKAIASHLALTPSTVHGYVGLLYRHFRVTTRAELMAYFLKRTPQPRTYS